MQKLLNLEFRHGVQKNFDLQKCAELWNPPFYELILFD